MKQSSKTFDLNDRELLVETINENINIIVDKADNTVSRDIKNTGVWGPRNMRAMARLIKAGDHALNAGSHIGLEAVNLGKIVGPTGKLYIFEPAE